MSNQNNFTDEELVERGMGLAVVARKQEDVVAIISDVGNRSFGQLNANANRLARVFRHWGLRSGDAVALVSPNRPEFVETLFACYRSGLRITAVNWHQSDDDIAYVVDNCEAKVLIGCAGRFDSALRKAQSQAQHVQHRVVFGGDLADFNNYSDLIAGQSGDDVENPENGNLMLYTSGTTGKPKGVYRVRRPLTTALFNHLNQSVNFGAGKDVSLVTGPLYHAAPLNLNMVQPISAGVTCVLMDKWDAEFTLRLIQKHRVTYTHLVPTMMQRLLALPDKLKQVYDISSLRYILHGAAPCPPQVKQSMIDWLGPVLFEYYAATEGGGVFCDSDQWLNKPGTVGRCVEGMTMKIINDAGEAVTGGESGTVYFQKPEVPFRYFKDASKTDDSYRGDFFTMGDVGYVDEEGFLFLTGRSAELVICGGVNVYPAQIDNVLIQHPDIADVACIGIPNEEFGEEIKAIVELRQGVEPNDDMVQSILAFGQQHLTGFMRPRSVKFVEELPRSDSGKVLRRQLKAMFGQ